MFRRTTSMPTPRPERSVTASAVEKPGAKIRFQTSASVGLSAIGMPFSRAFARMRSRLRPLPSSLTSMKSVTDAVGKLGVNPTQLTQLGGYVTGALGGGGASGAADMLSKVWR